jgi:hypothetical protein
MFAIIRIVLVAGGYKLLAIHINKIAKQIASTSEDVRND